jgi:hypothetical protein
VAGGRPLALVASRLQAPNRGSTAPGCPLAGLTDYGTPNFLQFKKN